MSASLQRAQGSNATMIPAQRVLACRARKLIEDDQALWLPLIPANPATGGVLHQTAGKEAGRRSDFQTQRCFIERMLYYLREYNLRDEL